MFLRQRKRKNGKTNLVILKGFRDPVTGNNKQKVVKNLGYLEDWLDQYDDPVAHFEKVAKEMTERENIENQAISFSIAKDEVINSEGINRKNLGYLVISYFYHLLGIDYFWNNRQKTSNADYNLNQVFQALIYMRILFPCSKKSSFEHLDELFFNFDFKLHDVYRALSFFHKYKKDLILYLHEAINLKFGRDMTNVYYDVTNYYFEIHYEDDLRKKGVSKEHRPNPIVQMGLLMDNKGVPISYELYEGNRNDCNTLMPSLHSLKDEFNLNRIIVVADKGMNSGENIGYNILNNNGYIYSETVRGASKEMKKYILNQSGYRDVGDFKIKSRIVNRNIYVEDINGKRKKVEIVQKQVVYYSEKYDKKAKYDRAKVIDKAERQIRLGITSPSNSSFKYIKKEFVDQETGEILEVKNYSALDEERIKEEEKYDGYYLIVTSELKMEDSDIVEAYRGLWKIEEAFKVSKSYIKSRPVYLSRHDRINAHFLICFISLMILRLIEFELKDKEISTEQIIETMRNITGTYIDENYYIFDYNNEFVEILGKLINIDFTKRIQSVADIRKMIADVK